MPGITVARDPVQKAFVVVVPDDKTAIADAALARRSELRWLRREPRAAIVAFCLNIPPDRLVCLRPKSPVQYSLGEPPQGGEGFLPIEPQFRLPGLFVREVGELDAEQLSELATKMKAWCAEHQVDTEELAKSEARSERSREGTPTSSVGVGSGANALERLLAAQTPEVAAQLTLPIDIALALSRIP